MSSITTASGCESGKCEMSITDRWCRSIVLRMMSALRHGRISLQDGDETYCFGSDGELEARIEVHDGRFYRKILFGGSIGAGESFIQKMWVVDDLTALVRIMVLNMGLLDRMDEGFSWLTKPADLLKHIFNSNDKRGAKKNILAHYDLGNEMYASFLDPTMMYSSAIYPHVDSTLEEAAVHKLDVICERLRLKPGDSVIEIGSGWGGFALHAAGKYGCHVTTTTISDAQYREAKKRIGEAGLDDRITLLQSDYRDLNGQYDKLVSIEMIEAVGHKFLPGFFRKCGELLKPDGMMLLQAITIADQKYDQYVRSVDFIQRYIFPGGCLPSNTRMLQLLSEQTDMVVRGISDFGTDYARTLQDWRKRFVSNFSSLRNLGFDETFKRLWLFYLCYCEGGFRERSISVVHLLASRPENRVFT